MKRFLYIVYPFLLIIVLALLSFIFNYTIIDVRIDDLDTMLKKTAEAQDKNNALGILAKYDLVDRRIKRGRESSEDYMMEGRVQAIIAENWVDDKKTSIRKKVLKKPVRVVLNIIRLILGKETQKEEKNNTKFEHTLGVGYYWERTRNYDNAAKEFKKLLEYESLDAGSMQTVMLHLGFCASMLGKYDDAIKIYENIIKLYPESDVSVTVWKLIDYVINIKDKLKQMKSTGVSGIEKGKRLYLLTSYRDAIAVFSRYLGSRGRSSKFSEARFFKGRSHEELGEINNALYEYRKIISKYPRSKWAKEANRRIFILGEFYEKDKKLSKSATKRIMAYRDDSFFGELKEYSSRMENSGKEKEIRERMLKKGYSNTESEADQNIEKMLDDITIDLTGEEAHKKVIENEIKSVKRERKTKKVSVQTLTRKRMAMGHPFRAPLAIKRVVTRNLDGLQYIYNKALKKGKEFSGNITINFVILANGKVGKVRIISSTTNNKTFNKNVIKRIKTWTFMPVPKDIGSVSINYPFVFSRKD